MEITDQKVDAFINQIDEPRRSDILKLIKIGRSITNHEPKMWGSIIGFGKLHYTYKTGRQGDMPQFGIANRKQAMTLYMSYHIEQYEALNRLGKYRTGKGCLYIKKLEDVDLNVLNELIVKAIKDLTSSDIIQVLE